jgi:hypothetical protein
MKKFCLLLVWYFGFQMVGFGQNAGWNLNPYFAEFLSGKPDTVLRAFFTKPIHVKRKWPSPLTMA